MAVKRRGAHRSGTCATAVAALACLLLLAAGCATRPPYGYHDYEENAHGPVVTEVQNLGSVEVYPGVTVDGLRMEKVEEQPVDDAGARPPTTFQISGTASYLLPQQVTVTGMIRVGVESGKGTFTRILNVERGWLEDPEGKIKDDTVKRFWVDDVMGILWPPGAPASGVVSGYSSGSTPGNTVHPSWVPAIPYEMTERHYEADRATGVETIDLAYAPTRPAQSTPSLPAPTVDGALLVNCYRCRLFCTGWNRDKSQDTSSSTRYTSNGKAITVRDANAPGGEPSVRLSCGPESAL